MLAQVIDDLITSIGLPPLHLAARNGKKKTIMSLVEKGVNVDARNVKGLTPLHFVVWHGRCDVIGLLLELGANISTPTSNGITPVCLAVLNSDCDTIRLLHDLEADVSGVSGTGEIGLTPMNIVTFIDCCDSVRLLFERGADDNHGSDRRGVITSATGQCDADPTGFMHDLGECLSTDERCALIHMACESWRLQCHQPACQWRSQCSQCRLQRGYICTCGCRGWTVCCNSAAV
jgi:hypothetical protein